MLCRCVIVSFLNGNRKVYPLKYRNISTMFQHKKHFDKLADQWWHINGSFEALHAFNPVRINFLRKHIESSPSFAKTVTSRLRNCDANLNFPQEGLTPLPLLGISVLDVGCGGGILAEGIAKLGATVTGIDVSEVLLQLAEKHLQEESPHLRERINYQLCPIKDMKKQIYNSGTQTLEGNMEATRKFDAIICSEVIEHVDNFHQFVSDIFDCSSLNGTVVFSSFNRTILSYLFAIIVAEYITKSIPKGTHEWSKFVAPSDLVEIAKQKNAFHLETQGLIYIPFLRCFVMDPYNQIQYIIAFRT